MGGGVSTDSLTLYFIDLSFCLVELLMFLFSWVYSLFSVSDEEHLQCGIIVDITVRMSIHFMVIVLYNRHEKSSKAFRNSLMDFIYILYFNYVCCVSNNLAQFLLNLLGLK